MSTKHQQNRASHFDGEFAYQLNSLVIPTTENRKNSTTLSTQVQCDKLNTGLSLTEKEECIRLMSKLPQSTLRKLLVQLTTAAQPGTSAKLHCSLTSREREVLILVANSYTRNEIASTLSISPNTAARHISNIYRKLDISSVAEATTFAISVGLTTCSLQ